MKLYLLVPRQKETIFLLFFSLEAINSDSFELRKIIMLVNFINSYAPYVFSKNILVVMYGSKLGLITKACTTQPAPVDPLFLFPTILKQNNDNLFFSFLATLFLCLC